MATTNVDRVCGARPVKHLSGSPYNGQCNKYFVPATDNTAIFIGDFVKSGGSADADGVPTVAQAAAGDALRGAVVGVIPDTADSLIYRAASTARYVLVADDPDLIFEIQEDGVGAALALVDVGENADIVVAAGNTTTGTSGMELDSSDHKTATAQLRILGFVQRPDNVPGVANAKVLVRINEHELASTTGV
jgi:hypothetical protein